MTIKSKLSYYSERIVRQYKAEFPLYIVLPL